jgi:hypothetical protein
MVSFEGNKTRRNLMFDLNLTADQIEFRDTVRDFVQNEVKPAALLPARLEPFEKPLLSDLLDDASRMGLRTPIR